MGASTFDDFHRTDDRSMSGRKKAFDRLVADAQHEHGHDRYSGTIGTKHDFVFIMKLPTLKEARDHAHSMIEGADDRIDDKWGPAGCIEVEQPSGFLFFGWAPS